MRIKILLFITILVFSFACGDSDEGRFVASGIVEGTAVKVSAQTGGLILKMYFDEGQDVEIGQTIAVIDTEKLSFRLEQIEAGLEEIEVQQQISHNTLEQAQIEYEHIKTKYERFLDLYEKQSASKQTIDDLKNALEVATTQLQSARQNLKLVESKQKQLQAERKLVARQIGDATITAPISGTITTQYFEAGETAPTGAPVVEMIDLHQMWTKIYVSEKMLPHIKIGQDATIKIDGTDTTLTGRVVWISPKAEFTPKNILTEENRTSLVYAVKVEVDNPDGLLKHGMPVEIALQL